MIRNITSLPPLHGYVLASPKDDPRATIVLSAPPKEGDLVMDDSDVDPILAVWRYGLGATAAFTSDMTEDWGRDWIAWEQFQQLVTQMVTRVGRVRRQQYLRVYTYVNGNEGVVVVEDFHPEETLLDMNVTVSAPDFDYSGQVRQVAPRRYQATIPLQGKARYQVQISAKGGERAEVAYGGFIVSYSPEYLRFEANPIVLNEIAEQTGGETLDADQSPEELSKQIYGRREPKRSTRSVFDWFLMALACMIPLDVAVRRVQLDFSSLRRLFRSQKKESTATMGTLLAKAESVRESMKGAPTQKTRTSPPTGSGRPEKRASLPPTLPKMDKSQKTKDTGTTAPKDAPATDDGGTTSKLLAMKRRREQEDS